MAKGRARADHGPAVLANISRLRSASERARCLIGPHRARHQLAADHLSVAKLAYRIAQWILPMLWYFGRKPACSAVADPRDPRRKLTRGVARVGAALRIWCLEHAVDETADRQNAPRVLRRCARVIQRKLRTLGSPGEDSRLPRFFI